MTTSTPQPEDPREQEIKKNMAKTDKAKVKGSTKNNQRRTTGHDLYREEE